MMMIMIEMKRARDSLTSQAERITKRSRIELQSGNIKDNVALYLLDVCCAKCGMVFMLYLFIIFLIKMLKAN
jgi:hypothetical protein